MNIPSAPMPAGQTVAGKVSWFGGPHDAETGSNRTATGTPSGAPGIAVYNRATLGGYWKVTAANGKSAVLKQTDLGPAPFTGRAIDVSSGALPKLGYSEQDFPTNSQFKATFLGHTLPTGAASSGSTDALPKGLTLKIPGTSSQQLDVPALQKAERTASLDKILLPELGGGSENPLRLVMPTTEPNPANFEVTKTTPAQALSETPSTPTTPAGPKVPVEGQSKALSAAVTQLGTPYRWGGEEEHKGFDCSGLAQWAYRAAGISIPRTAQEQFDASARHNGQPKPGELIFFGTSPSNVTHVEIVAGNGQMIGADHTGTNVRYEPIPQVGSKWGADTVLAIGAPTGKAGGAPADAVVAKGSGTVVGSYQSPAGPRAIVHVASGPNAGKVAHVAAKLPVGHQFQPGEILGEPLKHGLGGF